MPRNPGLAGRDTRGRKVERPFDGKCHRKLNRPDIGNAVGGKGEKVRVKAHRAKRKRRGTENPIGCKAK